ncbi:MAG: cytochrome c oxidase assembly protein [Dehalococcoidia bacterium]|nr:cytochrome c oxidase assembly protein [Dehalococcoidia bacterium]
MEVSWWCSARPISWSWDPQFFPGIWVVMLCIIGSYFFVYVKSSKRSSSSDQRIATNKEKLSFVAGWVLLWVMTDWPIGVLGSGYLLSAHMLQYVIYSLVIAPLLVGGITNSMVSGYKDQWFFITIRSLISRPFVCFVAFNIVLAITHIPYFTDILKPLQLGQMLIDILWISVAILFWAAIGTFDDQSDVSLARAQKLLYIIGITLLPTIPGAFFVFSDFPIYTTYEFATRVFNGISAREDQMYAGLIMWMGMTPILLIRLAMAFFSWSEAESRRAGTID